MTNILQKTFGKEKRWVNYALMEIGGKTTKVPFSAVTEGKASSTDEATWAKYDVAKARDKEHIGIVFTPAQTLLGIDIDHCIENGKIVHEQKDIIARLIYKADSYCELSPSGTGLHILIRITEALPLLANKKAPFECYTSGRYFTVTEKPYGIAKEVKTMTPNEAKELLALIGYPWRKEIKKEESFVLNPQPVSMEDSVLLEKMFNSKNGVQVKALYDGDTSAQKGDDSSADMALCAHLAFWTGRNGAQMERIWLASPLGQRAKTQERQDYRTRTIESAISKCTKIYEPPMQKVLRETKEADPEHDDIDLLWSYDKQKNIVYTQNTENMCRILRKHQDFRGRFHYDIFKNALEILENNKWRDLEDNDSVAVQTAISIIFPCFGKVGKDMVYDAIVKVSRENQMDSAVDYIRSVKWDGTKRLDGWLSETYGVEDNEYHRKVGSNWFKGLVKRIMHPGCKFDYVLVLEGEQGTKKSTSLGVLGGAWHVETTMGTDSKDFFMQFQGKAIIEFSEGETLNRTEVKKMKAIITTQSDKYRPAYGRLSIDFPRRCVFAMTTNQEEYLKDETGNRRWLPVACKGVADIEWLRENRDQLYAEAYQRVIVDQETTWEFPEEDTARNQNDRRIHDPNQDLICDWYVNKLSQNAKSEGITVYQVYRDAICSGFVGKPLDRWMEMSIGDTLRNALRLEKRRKMVNDIQSMRWFQKGAKEMDFGVEQPKTELEKYVEDLKK